MKESLVAFSKLLISDEELSESVEPGMGRFHHPASILPRTPSPSSAVPSWNPWYVALYTDLFANRIAIITFIRIQESLPAFWKIDDEGIEHGRELTEIMSMGPGNDQRQRDATSVHQDVPLASFFFPVRRVRTGCFSGQRRFDRAPVDALPFPGNPLHLIILREACAPQGEKEACFQPLPEVLVNRASHSRTVPWAMTSTGSLS